MPYIKTLVRIPHKNQLPNDAVENVFVFFTAESPPYTASCLEINSELLDFYNAIHGPGSQTVANYISSTMTRNTNTCEFIHTDISTVLNGDPAGSPFRRDTWTLGSIAAGTTNLPSEVAAVVSYHSDYLGLPEHGIGLTRPKARRRGRIYVGPLNSSAVETDVNGRVHLSSAFIPTLAASAATLAGHQTAPVNWMQWSRTNAQCNQVIGGHVDDAFDTQRRRGEDSQTRTLWGTQ